MGKSKNTKAAAPVAADESILAADTSSASEAAAAEARDGGPTAEPQQPQAQPEVAEPSDASPTQPKKKSKKSKGDLTLADLAERYLAHMEKDGKSSGTISSYQAELRLAQDDLGAETPVSTLTPQRVLAFFQSKRVVKLESGKAKSQLSIDKTRRVLRLALVWAQGARLIERAPIPEMASA